MWLGKTRGFLQDWLTQQWVKVSGRRYAKHQLDWLKAPTGATHVIADEFLSRLAQREELEVCENLPDTGLLDSVEKLELTKQEQQRISKSVIDFYLHTLNYEFEVWSRWNGWFAPFGQVLNSLFTQRLQQLNLPLDPLQTARGLESNIYKLLSSGGEARWTVWFRRLKATGDVLYSGSYSTTTTPLGKRCLSVSFPLPNGSATVVMRPEVLENGALRLSSDGSRFGEPGFYLTLQGKQYAWARFVKAMHETITVYEDEEQVLRADHVLFFYGFRFLHLHYKMVKIGK